MFISHLLYCLFNIFDKIILRKDQKNLFEINNSKYQNKYHYFIIFIEKIELKTLFIFVLYFSLMT
jgi:hypothetical protein